MKVLHICNDYSYSKVYMNLYSSLDRLNVEQVIYHPLRSDLNINKNKFEFLVESSKLVYSKLRIKSFHRIFFRLKAKQIYKDLINQIDVTKFDVSYPTTLFSDGAIALRLFEKFKLPYIVAVRNTDVNLFLKFRPDLIPLAHRILQNAKKIIFISEGLKGKFYSHPKIKNLNSNYLEKTEVISNGIDDVWHDQRVKKLEFKPKSLNFLFVGRFDRNKNIVNVIKALDYLKTKYPTINLNLIGGGGDRNNEVMNLVSKHANWIKYHGYIKDKSSLLNNYRLNDFFIMPSFYETFGLVYLEALSQGLPVLFTKNQGIDGLFTDNVGIGVFPDYYSIINGIIQLIDKPRFNFEEIHFEKYRWQNIADRYISIFKNLI